MFEAVVAEMLETARSLAGAEPPAEDLELLAETEALLELLGVVQGLAADRLRLVDERDAADAAGRSSVSSWVAARPGGNPREASALLALARAAQRHPVTGRLWREGAISSAHARIAHRALRGLPPELQDAGDAFLAPAAREMLLADFAVVAEAWRDTVTPELSAEQREAEADEQVLTLSPTDGGLLVRGWLTGLNAAWLQAAVDRFSRPAAHDARDAGRRRADALGIVSRLAAATSCDESAEGEPLPAARVTVIADPVTLQRAVGAREVDAAICPPWVPAEPRELVRTPVDERTGLPLTTAELLASVCDGPLSRALLDPDGVPLDLGRDRRLFSGPQRRALARGGRLACSWKRCGSPFVEAHHDRAWAAGGATDLANGRLLCSYHHGLIHAGWHLEPNGRPIPPPDWHLRRRRRRRVQNRGAPPPWGLAA